MQILAAGPFRFYLAVDRIPYAATERLFATTFEVVCLPVVSRSAGLVCGSRITAEKVPSVISPRECELALAALQKILETVHAALRPQRFSRH